MESLIARLFYSRELAHRAHLRTTSYAQHVALGPFYDSIVDNADAIAEAWQGRHGLMGAIPFIIDQPSGDIAADLRVQLAAVEELRSEAGDDTAIQNLIDAAVETFLSTLYKLDNLK